MQWNDFYVYVFKFFKKKHKKVVDEFIKTIIACHFLQKNSHVIMKYLNIRFQIFFNEILKKNFQFKITDIVSNNRIEIMIIFMNFHKLRMLLSIIRSRILSIIKTRKWLFWIQILLFSRQTFILTIVISLNKIILYFN